ncbi:hypothetical protein DFP72DRAFT_818384 [Ephemerocybe angulata]|uniref:HMG domain-containing protein n=1 Tax=Ephemerocybe angulata TaxID=980116 RepID=A0A8H6HQE4_9AGAR|nr:hypothetical protein DFP72DRAFT_818384 [Tulosesus angulatus]
MPPKRKNVSHDSSSECSDFAIRVSESDSEEEEFSYPNSLLDDARVAEWESPSVASRTYAKPLTRRKRVNPPDSQSVVARPSTSPEPLPSVLSVASDALSNEQHGDPDLTSAQLSNYRDAVEASVAGFYFIGGTVFVVEGWDLVRQRSAAGWYHLQYIWISGALHVVCTCPVGIDNRACVHRELFKTFELDVSAENGGQNEVNEDSTLFLRQQQINSPDEFLSVFSVRSFSSSHLKGRAIVTHVGSSATDGVWRCSKDAGTDPCVHVRSAHRRLHDLLGGEAGDLEGVSIMMAFKPGGSANRYVGSISHLPILPPAAIMLPSDPRLYSRPPPLRSEPPPLLRLNENSTCSCSPGKPLFNPVGPVATQKCRVFTLVSAYKTDIQLQPCPECPRNHHRHVGPDLRELGIFNFNNSILVTHDLLDEYTIAFTVSETPFTAFVHMVNLRYGTTGGCFMGEDLFQDVWFAYVIRQALNNDMRCPRSGCGDYPDTVIFDGITLAFGRKHISGSLIPPTTSDSTSIVRPTVKNNPKQQLISNATLRKQVRRIIEVPSFDSLLSEEDDNDESDGPSAEQQARQEDRARLHFKLLDDTVSGLREESPALASLFHEVYKSILLSKKSVSPAYRNFFRQVAAEESVLQMFNGSALENLRTFLANPIPYRLTEIITVPAVYNLLKPRNTWDDVIPILHWMLQRGDKVLQDLKRDPDLGSFPLIAIEEKSWAETGALYSFPQIRHRPIYPKLRTDQRQDTSKPRGDRCGKYYNQYGERRLTGGIMVAWCTHSICYGFHHIPESEGRNDVFSALVTRWPTAPHRVVYDFACALGPYCMIREPHFFENTLFVIDHFHSRGHTKCSPAAFLSEYANTDPRLVPINSSAAECGNSSLKRIRKSVSYMSQRRAVIYTKVFISVWNRLRLV